jgi:aminoglycoside/choline kinase family phosphotransferase
LSHPTHLVPPFINANADIFTALFATHFGTPHGVAPTITPIAPSGSYRSYHRLHAAPAHTALAVHNPNPTENTAFAYFTQHLAACNVNVPQIYAQNPTQNCYLIQDLGDQTLMQLLKTTPHQATEFYQKALVQLYILQTNGAKNLDTTQCTPTAHFDRQTLLWDLNYFKYCFLKLSKINFDEAALEQDFNTLANFLCLAPAHFLIHRDYQARNLMVHQNDVYIIDYQGCRLGPAQYDVAALLYQAQAQLSPETRTHLLHFYLNQWQHNPDFAKKFLEFYPAFVLIRILQALGAYGFRGIIEQKTEFISSIHHAFTNLTQLLSTQNLGIALPTLTQLISQLQQSDFVQQFAPKTQALTPKNNEKLTITITSFSYKKGGIPPDPTTNGGGFVFDCRAIHNPGRYHEYKQLTGMDASVIDFLKTKTTADAFLKNICAIVEPSIKTYLDRDFEHLMINFGCTGGQHRSVYCAQTLAQYLHAKFGTKIALHHIEQQVNQDFLHTNH